VYLGILGWFGVFACFFGNFEVFGFGIILFFGGFVSMRVVCDRIVAGICGVFRGFSGKFCVLAYFLLFGVFDVFWCYFCVFLEFLVVFGVGII